mmetsp:Transcript_8668/g.12594  ORF Transcript_8668/g.12594 Transcript_8668/m.12594 type:complete len:137 (+) Transcript_8668:104-514(+)
MTLYPLKIEQIQASFLHQTLHRQSGRPTFADIHAAHKQLNANAAAIPSPLGGGAHGLLCLTLSPTQYQARTEATVVTPPNPGLTPVYPTRFLLPAEERALNREHQVARKTYEDFRNTDTSPRNLLLKAFDKNLQKR